MYQALYRKYRPKTFDDVIGQDIVITTLKNSIINNKISHAYLLSGPRGCGKTTIAKIFSQLVNCENSNGKEICNKCVFCTQKNNQSLDIIEMDAASNNGVDEIREINNKASLTPSIGKYKIYIIDEVHMLTTGAFNALLKTLEEPPAHVIFILATTDPQKVPITILSRCQRFDLKKIGTSKIFERLKYICNQEKIKYEEKAILEIAKLGDGCLRDSIGILDQVISYIDDGIITMEDVHIVTGTLPLEEISILMNYLVDNDIKNIMDSITNYSNEGKSIVKITEDIINFIKSCLLLKSNIKNENIELYQKFVEKYDIEQLLEHIKIMNDTLFEMKKFSDTKLLLELAFIKIITKNNMDQEAKEFIPINKENKEVKHVIDKKIENNIENINSKNISQEILEKFIGLRINNTLSEFSKKITTELKKDLLILANYMLDNEFGKYITMILDGNLRAASNRYMIFTYETEHLSSMFNKNIEKIEELISKYLNKKYKVISVSNEKWDIIKKEFNNKEKNYEFIEEDINIKLTIEKDDINSIFGELIEYE